MLSKIIQFVKEHQEDIILLIGVILISLLSFAAGYITARQQKQEPLKFEEATYEKNEGNHYWRGDSRALSCLEIVSRRP